MNNSQQDEQQALEQYLEDKAKEEQEIESEAEALSEYEACVLRESARVRELMAGARRSSEGE